MAKSITYNTLAQLTAKLVSMSLTILATVLITRYFGRAGYGEFSLMQALPALFFILADFGLNTTALKIISTRKELVENHYNTVLYLRLATSCGLILLLGLVTLLLPYSTFLKSGILLSALLILTQALYSTTNLVFQYARRYDLSAVGYVAGSIVTIGFIVLWILSGLDVRYMSFAYVLGGIVTFAVNAKLISRLGYRLKLYLNPAIAKTVLYGSIPLGIMFVFSQINFKADALLLSLMKLPPWLQLSNIEAVATYSLPYKVFEVALVVPTFFMNSVFPVFVQKLAANPQELKKVYLKTLKLLGGLGLCASLGSFVLAPLLIRLLGGSGFDQSVTVLRILSVGLAVFFLSQPTAYLIVTLDKQRYLPLVYVIGSIFNVSLNLVLIPQYGFYASAFLTWISELVILALLGYFARKAWKDYLYASRS
ncbi:TPA: hypothetical protein DCY43_03955 [candidate division WWE3 bacterium]|uniref:Polysaccharide biosynthesis protein n=4 Tax=Katanobacteria TaxID=422282 RepID=A0A0G1MS65_UNCKA|nr:MAG: Polysaccharide biosynthesis protein [candidate division WWE3 bacterium GW2011_GWA2_44_16]KKT83602.1 MAG: Polysaccharide biosynthesis protein [candidate division WWE3 bacterium GW2011_GWC2_44_9]OGC52332.1 MAG: hypothetical protein A2709_03285 [candidate division WWE3 bacterium RIFCSPHIGHO2_01_FULL_43_9]HAZ29863.1 hypothetical protein [candidate division WWE3 bacterium]